MSFIRPHGFKVIDDWTAGTPAVADANDSRMSGLRQTTDQDRVENDR